MATEEVTIPDVVVEAVLHEEGVALVASMASVLAEEGLEATRPEVLLRTALQVGIEIGLRVAVMDPIAGRGFLEGIERAVVRDQGARDDGNANARNIIRRLYGW